MISRNGENFIKQFTQPNLTQQQIDTIKSIRKNTDLIIKPADKGGAVVVMNAELYKQEAARQLNNTNYYSPLPGPIYTDTAIKIYTILEELNNHGFISRQQLNYLKADKDTMTSRYFYLLPKIHKAQVTWPHPQMPAGRPIVSDCNSESYRICEYIDYFLQPLSVRHPAYLKDTYDFIAKVKDYTCQPNWLLISADVESLYTNMRIDIILDSIREIFQEYRDPRRSDSAILSLLELTLRNNDFEFDGLFYLQTCGIAMGRQYAPSAANIYLRKFDHNAMNNFRIKPILYSRFLDDIFALWPGSRSDLDEYESFLNNLIPGIKVKFTARDQIIEFLDTHVYKHTHQDGTCKLQTKIYFKQTDTHQLLHRKSFHPSHTFRGIVKSQFIRFKRIASNIHDYNQAASTLIHTLRTRGYNLPSLLKQKRTVWKKYDTTPKQPDQQKKQLIPVITHFDHFHFRLNRKWSGLIRSNDIFNHARIISAYRRHKNLRDLLVRGRLGAASLEDNTEELLDALIDALNKEAPA